MMSPTKRSEPYSGAIAHDDQTAHGGNQPRTTSRVRFQADAESGVVRGGAGAASEASI